MKSTRAAAPVVVLYVVGAALMTQLVPNWRIGNLFKKGPPVVQLTELQAKLAAEQANAKLALANLEAAKAMERAKLEQQIRAAQQDALGAQTALKKVPAAHRTPEVNLADRMATRVSLKLATAIGKLPQEEQDAMIELIEQALSDKQAEVDEANRKLAEADAAFKAVTGERDQLKVQIPKLADRAVKAEEAVVATQAEKTKVENRLKVWATTANTALHENGSLISTIKRVALVLVAGYCFLAFGLPSIVKVLKPGNPMKSILRDTAGYLLNPVLHHDAKNKLALKPKPPTV